MVMVTMWVTIFTYAGAINLVDVLSGADFVVETVDCSSRESVSILVQ